MSFLVDLDGHLVSHAPDSLRESLVHYSRVVRSGLVTAVRGLKFIRVVHHSAMNNIKIIDAHNLIRLM